MYCRYQWSSVCDGDSGGLASCAGSMRHHATNRQRRQSGVRLVAGDRRTQSVSVSSTQSQHSVTLLSALSGRRSGYTNYTLTTNSANTTSPSHCGTSTFAAV